MSARARRHGALALTTAALVVLTACSTPDDTPTPTPATSSSEGTPSAAPSPTRPATASETAQEAFRIAEGKDVASRSDACQYFDPDAFLVMDAAEGRTVPMTRWCGSSATDQFPEPGWTTEGQTPSIEEEVREDTERWVRLLFGPNEQRMAALVESADGWLITRWCTFSPALAGDVEGDDDPFYCLRETK